MTSKTRGIRGAVTVDANTAESIQEGTEELLKAMLETNAVPLEEIASIFFSVTPDLNAQFPARGARRMGLLNTPLMCMQEIPVPGDVERCIRILVLYNTDTPQDAVRHVYLREARRLRPDLDS